MPRTTLPILSQVLVDTEAEHFAGQTAYIIDIAEDEEYAYCVSRSPTMLDVSQCEWVKRDHVRPVDGEPQETEVDDEGQDFKIGDPVLIKDYLNGSIFSAKGYVAAIDGTRIGISSRRGKRVVDWVEKKFVNHAT